MKELQNRTLPSDPISAAKKNRKGALRFTVRTLMAFLIPGLLLLLAFAIQRVFPFGDRHILTVDLYHQYAPFLGELRDKLLHGGSLFYSWRAGLGINFFALFSYYLASPLNLITLLFPEHMLSEMVLSLVLLKVSFAGMFFHLFLKKAFRRDGPLSLGFSTAYALSAYTMAYFWNIMWLDTVALLPLAAWGMAVLVRDRKPALYVFSLALLIYSNYYTGFFACIFLGLFFFSLLERFGRERSAADNVLTTVNVLIASIIAAMMSMVSVLPTMYALQRTSAAGDQFPQTFDKFNPFIDFFERMLPLGNPSIRSGPANIYVGLLTFILIAVYFASKHIPLRRKIVNGSILAFLLLSFNNNYLNFIWHGFHYPNQLPYRNSFVFCFFALTLAYDVLPALRAFEQKTLACIAGGGALILLFLEKVDGAAMDYATVFMSFVLLAVYTLFLMLFAGRYQRVARGYYWHSPLKLRYQVNVVSNLLLCIILIELMINTAVSINTVAGNEYFGVREGYRVGTSVEEIMEFRESVQKDRERGPVRMEIMPDKCVNDSMLYLSNGLTIFSSTFPKSPVRSFKALGFANNGINSFQYYGSTPVLDNLFGIRYVLRREKYAIDERMKEKVAEKTETELYENKRALPIAYLADKAALEKPLNLPDSGNCFDAQGNLLYALSGEISPFDKYFWTLADSQSENLSVTAKDDPEEFQIVRNDQKDSSAEFSLTAEKSGSYYIGWRLNGVSLTTLNLVKTDDNTAAIGKKATGMTELGYFEEGETIRVRFELNSAEDLNKTATLNLYAACLDEERYETAMDKLHEDPLEFVFWNDRELRLRTRANEAKTLFFAFTEDPGWSCFVDGEKVEIKLIDGTFPAVALSPGEHEVLMQFTPKGFVPGAIMSGAGLCFALLFILSEYFHRRSQRQKTGKQTEPPEKNGFPDPLFLSEQKGETGEIIKEEERSDAETTGLH